MLTFKRGTHSDLDNTNITNDMLYFTTDDNSIYFDSEGERYKIFGFNNSDIITSLSDASINKYFNKSSDIFLSNSKIAMSGDTTNQLAIGTGYYNDVIGDTYRLFFNKSITDIIYNLQTEGRSNLSELWVNDSPSNYWTQDLTTSQTSTSESKNFNISTAYLGYILLFQPYLDNNTMYTMITYALPSSITDNQPIIKYEDWDYKIGDTTSTNIRNISAGLQLQLSGDNYKTVTITKTGRLLSGTSSVDFHKYLIPIKLYGWSV